MNQDERLDLSALEPAPGHWRALTAATLARVDEVLARRPQDPLSLIASWTRPLLISTAVVLALLVPFELVLEMREAQAEQVERLVALSSRWVGEEAPPSGEDFLRALAERERP